MSKKTLEILNKNIKKGKESTRKYSEQLLAGSLRQLDPTLARDRI